MKRTLPILIVLLVAMYFTNPDRTDFRNFISEHLQERIESDESESEFSRRLGKGAGDALGVMADAMAERRNFYIFSIYSIPGVDEGYEYLGVFTTFIPLQSKQPLDL